MSENPYTQFFSKAGEIKRGPEAKKSSAPRFKIESKGGRTKEGPPPSSGESQERRLRAALKMNRTQRVRAPVPMKAVAGLLASLMGVTAYLVSPATFERLWDRIEVRALGAAEAADAETGKKSAGKDAAEKSQTPPTKGEKPAAASAGTGATKGASEKSEVAEDLGHYEKLKQRKEELDAREKELNELEEELQRQKVELDKRITQLEEMRNQIAQTLKDRVDVDQEKVNKLVDLYSNMKPKQAADVLGSLNEELAVEVLAKMKKKNAAEIMNLLPPEKARVLSEKYTGYRRVSSTEPKG